jgi:hypothetical protein
MAREDIGPWSNTRSRKKFRILCGAWSMRRVCLAKSSTSNRRGRPKTPNSKFQIPINAQAPIPNEQEFGANRRFHTDAQWFFFRILDLDFEIYLGFGAWDFRFRKIPNEQEFGANRRFHTDAQWFFFRILDLDFEIYLGFGAWDFRFRTL